MKLKWQKTEQQLPGSRDGIDYKGLWGKLSRERNCYISWFCGADYATVCMCQN